MDGRRLKKGKRERADCENNLLFTCHVLLLNRTNCYCKTSHVTINHNYNNIFVCDSQYQTAQTFFSLNSFKVSVFSL